MLITKKHIFQSNGQLINETAKRIRFRFMQTKVKMTLSLNVSQQRLFALSG